MANLACPCCGYRTIKDAGYGSYMLCPLCDWEDDGVQLANPCSAGGANTKSLHEEQIRFAALETDVKGFVRDQAWRPLTANEVAYFQAAAQKEHWSFEVIVEPHNVYWLKK